MKLERLFEAIGIAICIIGIFVVAYFIIYA